MKKLLFLIPLCTLSFTVNAADAFSTLEERMSGKEFKETGLVKLTDEELSVLNEWLRSHSVATLSNSSARQTVIQVDNSGMVPLTTSDTRGLGYMGVSSSHDPGDKLITGTLVGTISGWAEKNTEFKLTNGMVWEQTGNGSLSIQAVNGPDVTITKSFLGNWHLSIVGHEADVRVKRIR
jgi:hypothetical protein